MIFQKGKLLFVLLIALVFVLAACGGGETPATEAPAATVEAVEPTTAPTAETVQEPAEPESGAIQKISEAKQAIIQIEAVGSFVDPQVGQVFNGAGRGSGFIFDPSGLAVTNNHVVTGSALLKVWVGGEQGKTYNARVLGVSECADLAVIDIEGSGFPYLDWYQGTIDVGTEIYVAGFPLGDPEYSLTKGIISKARADGETSWASVDSVIEYDATTNPGNSGGPVLTANAEVVGVHYAGNAQTRQAFGISRQIAKDVVDVLKTGENQDWIGVNGQAVSNEDGSLTGVWVSSVQSGSPADKAGLKGGDIVTTMENLVLATDGTMSDYCDILRSHKSTDTLNLEVLRFGTGEVLEGQLNGRELATVATFGGSGNSNEQAANTNTNGDDNTNGGDDNTNAGDDTQGSGMLNLNASASGDSYYESDFDAPLSDWVYFLMSGQESGASADISDGKLKIDIQDPQTWIYFYLDPLDVADVGIGTRYENLGRNSNSVSLICRYSDQGWYEFNVAMDGTYNIYRYDTTLGDYVALYSGGSTAINIGKDTNEIVAVCIGNQLTLVVNDTTVRTVTDKNLKSGKIGLSLSSYNSTPIVGEFDYFVAVVP
ncbi:MAG: S1C family serine protease [Anaerolineales bacterium]|jgi:serine protease Do|nr:S1C family serine protease [Anaerolineales bacterium]